MGRAVPSTTRPTGSPYTPTSASVHRPTAETPSRERARGALARRTRPRTAARAHHVHSACQRCCRRPGCPCGVEVSCSFQLLCTHDIIARHECMRHVGIMRACTSLHAEVRLYHHPHPFHAKGTTPRAVSRPRAHVPPDLTPALRRRRAGLLCASWLMLNTPLLKPGLGHALGRSRFEVRSPSGEGHAHAASLRAT